MGARLGHGDTGLQKRHDAVIVTIALGVIGIDRGGQPKVGSHHLTELMGDNANDGTRDAIDRQGAPDGRRIGMKTALPEGVADEDGGGAAGAILLGQEITPGDGFDAEGGKKLLGCGGGRNALGLARATYVEAIFGNGEGSGHLVKRGGLAFPIQVVGAADGELAAAGMFGIRRRVRHAGAVDGDCARGSAGLDKVGAGSRFLTRSFDIRIQVPSTRAGSRRNAEPGLSLKWLIIVVQAIVHLFNEPDQLDGGQVIDRAGRIGSMLGSIAGGYQDVPDVQSMGAQKIGLDPQEAAIPARQVRDHLMPSF